MTRSTRVAVSLLFALLLISVRSVKIDALTAEQEDALAKQEQDAAAKQDCIEGKRKFNPLYHKETYKVAVHAIRGLDAARNEYSMLFENYLTATAGHRFDPPIKFEMVPVTSWDLFAGGESGELDFFLANPGLFTCIGLDMGAQALATIVSRLKVRGHVFDLDVFGGVIATREDRDDINSILDLKDKIIAAGSISMVNAAQTQFYEMVKAGMSYVMDPKQVVFTHNQDHVVAGILSGEFDVGFVRTDQLERTVDEDGKLVDTDRFKVISPKIYVMDTGDLFPFLHSTNIYPEWPVSAFTHVNKDVAEEVQKALLAFGKHAYLGKLMDECHMDLGPNSTECDTAPFPESFDPEARCDSTRELTDIANSASDNGKFAAFRPARSYFMLRTMLETAELLEKDKHGNWQCSKADTLYDGIMCPEGHYKRSKKDFDSACEKIGLTCAPGRDCYCKPCVKANEVDVYSVEKGEVDFHSHEYNGTARSGCEKMSLCDTVEQTKPILFRAWDNKERDNPIVEAIMHVGDHREELEVNHANGTFAYEFAWHEHQLAVGILEVFFDGEQIPDSPIRVQVVERNCEFDFPGHGMEPDGSGTCVCGKNTVELFDKCIASVIFFVVIAIIAFMIAGMVGLWYLGYKRKQSDQMWLVNVEELHFSEPVEVIGQGSFGVVLLAEYRGTKVAIKRILDNKSRKKGGSRSGGSKEQVSGGSRDGTADSPDLEVGVGIGTSSAGSFDKAGTTGTVSILRSGTSSDMDEQLDFLGDLSFGGRKRSKWAKLFPWVFADDQFHMKSNLLGSASGASQTERSFASRMCPYFDPQARRTQEFIVEMRLLSRLRHPCITTVMGAVISRNTEPMLCMEYMEYGSLHDLLRNETMYAGGEIILQIVRDISQGLRYLHSSKPPILHGDLKAKNILIDSRFRAKVADFGLATKSKGLSGTPYFMAPEYLRGKTEYNTACDIYAVGIILWEIYARNDPYHGEHPRKVLRKVCDPRVNKRPPVPDETPPKLIDIMKKCWSPDPFFRPSAQDLDLLFMDMNMTEAEPLSKEQSAAHARNNERPTEEMMYEVFPKHIADALIAGQKVEPESHENVTVIFSDIVHFEQISKKLSPMQVSNMLDRLYMAMDTVSKKHKVFKVETVGDSFMGVTNLNNSQEDTHVKCIAEFSIDAIDAANEILINEEDPKMGYVRIRVGFHSGPVVSNVIGSLNPRYGLFGDTVNTASRMESNSVSRKIQCSERSARILKEQAPNIPLTKRGKISVKGKGEMVTYWVGDMAKHNEDDGKPHVDFSETG